MRTASIGALALPTALTVAVFALSINARAQAEQTPPVPQAHHTKPQPLVAPGEPPDLVMFYTGDVIGYLTPCG